MMSASPESHARPFPCDAVFDSAEVRTALNGCCKSVANHSASDLLERLRAEVRVAELAHNFPAVAGGHFSDMTISLMETYPWYLNQYEVALVGGSPPPMTSRRGCTPFGCPHPDLAGVLGADTPNFENYAEETIFGCPPFVGRNPTWDEATNRLIYVALNVRRADTGSMPTFGDVGMVFRHKDVAEMVEIAAIDTGLWEMSCNTSSTPGHGFHLNINCTFGDITKIGTLDHFDHVLLGNLGIWAASGKGMLPPSTIGGEAAKLLARSGLADAGYDALSPQDNQMDVYKYLESNLLGNPPLEAVKVFLPLFGAVFGTARGALGGE